MPETEKYQTNCRLVLGPVPIDKGDAGCVELHGSIALLVQSYVFFEYHA